MSAADVIRIGRFEEGNSNNDRYGIDDNSKVTITANLRAERLGKENNINQDLSQG